MERAVRRTRPWLAFGVAVLALLAGLILWRDAVSSAAGDSLAITFTPPPGRYLDDIALRLETDDPSAAIYYTLDGRPPDPASAPRYTAPIPLSAATPQVIALRARAYAPDGRAGPVASATYMLGLQTSLPVLSLIVDPADLNEPARGIYVNHEERGREWERPVDVAFITPAGETAFQSGAGLRVHGEWTRWFFDKKSWRLYFRDDYGAAKLEYPLFGPAGQVAFDHLYLHNSDQDLLLFRNQLVERLAADMGGYRARSQPALLFINGEPWGIYTIRERINERFLRENYSVPDASVMDTPNIPGRQSAAQRAVDLPHWDAFMDFVTREDLARPENYAYVQTQLDVSNFVDYFLLQMYAANTDWPHHNVEQFRPWTQGGRWIFLPWDSDLAFESVQRQMVDHVLTAVHPLGVPMQTLLNKLLANPDFYNLFLTRAADLLNTTLAAPQAGAHVEDLLAELAPDAALEQARWNVPGAWDDMAAHMRDYTARRPDLMRQHFVESFELPGTAVIDFAAADVPGGWVAVNETAPQPLPWQGTYFIGTTIRLRAVPPPGSRFAGWDGLPATAVTQNGETLLPITGDLTLQPRFVPRTDGEIGPEAVRMTAVHPDDGERGDWFELQIGPAPVDLRGWRLTDNDSLDAADEGSLLFKQSPLLADLLPGTVVRVFANPAATGDGLLPADGWQAGVLVLHAGGEALDAAADPWFNLGLKDNLLLLAPGPSGEVAVDLWSSTTAVQPADFGLPPR